MEEPSSPGTNPVDMKDCIEEMLKFTLDSHIKETLEFDLGLSKDFRSLLLEDSQCHTDVADCVDKDLQYPLYKLLASSLYESIASGAFCGRESEMASLKENDVLLSERKEDDKSKQKQKWLDLILDRGFEILNILKSINFELHVQEPFFTQLRDGHKTVEGRCATGDYNRYG
ncbi:hypothetical protein HS088_TW16G00348 [Tripterygium wilfordii]|uniref:Uncharacterized protein n=1 Tax=Tripterygium wilfordii TaxID=458696 RepID=A0A7J7CIM7_TRIWF|nr:hypothetical protein HS088_TW16G00348 [Tripterygium wilfordii]